MTYAAQSKIGHCVKKSNIYDQKDSGQNCHQGLFLGSTVGLKEKRGLLHFLHLCLHCLPLLC